MNVRLFSLLLCCLILLSVIPTAASAAAIPYDLWVGGVQVDGANCDDIPGFENGKASFDPDTNTLTLTGVSGPKGTKEVEDDDDWGAAILNGLSEPLTINGTGDVTVTGNNYAVYGGDIVIDPESELSFTGSYGIHTDSLTVSGGTLTVKGSSNSAIRCDYITISGGTVTTDGSTNGLWVDKKLTVTGGVINVTGGGIMSYGNVSISGTNTELTAKATNTSGYAVRSSNKPTISEPLIIVKPEGCTFEEDDYRYFYASAGGSIAKEIVIKNPNAPEYALTGFSATVPGVEEDDGYYWPKSNQTCQWTWKDDKAPDGGKTGVSFGKLWMDKEKNNPLTSEPAVGTPYYVEYTLSKDDVDFSQLTTNGCEMKLEGYTTECVELKAGTLNGEGVVPCVDILFKLTKDDPYAIKEIRVNGYESPVAGEKAGDYLNLSVPDGCHYTIIQQYWYCETAGSTINTEDEFIAGKKYSCCAYVKPEEGYHFADGVKLYVNNSEDMVWSAFSHVDDNKDAFIYTVPETATSSATSYAIGVNTYDISLDIKWSGGQVSLKTDWGTNGFQDSGYGFSATEGSTVEINAVPDTDYEFVEWRKGSKDGAIFTASANYTFTATEALDLYAIFQKAAATTTYPVTVINGAAYSDAARTKSITEAAEGDTIYVDYDPPAAGKYVKEITYSEGAFSQTDYMNGVTMPAKAVTFTVVYADQTEYTVDLTSGSTTAPWQACFTNVPYGVIVSLPLSPMDRDLDGDGNNDVTFSYYLYDDFVTVTKHSDTNIETSYDVTPAFFTNTPYSKVTYVFGGGIVTPDIYTVTFDANGHGTAPTAQTVEDGKTATKPSDPTETGWKFDGWYKEADCINAFDFATPITGNITLYAKWTEDGGIVTPDIFTVTFDANGHGTAPAAQTIEDGKTATKPDDPTASGWTFKGWYKEAACTNAFDFATPITGDITLYAKWTQNSDTPTAPQTGDSGRIGLWIALMAISLIGLGGATVFGRKKRTNR